MVMKIGVLLDELEQGGVQKIAINEVKWLRVLGHDAKLLVVRRRSNQTTKDEEYVRKIAEGPIPILFLSDRFPRIFRLSFRFPLFHFFSSFHLTSPLLASLTLKEKFDVLISHGTYTCFTAEAIRKIHAIQYVMFVHDTATYILSKAYANTPLAMLRALGTFVDRKTMENAALILTQSNFTMNQVKRIYNRGRVEVVYPGCKPVEHLPKKRENIVLMYTRWDRGKNPFLAVKIAQRLKDINVRIIVAGTWSQENVRSEIIRELEARRLKDKVEVIDDVDENELENLFLKSKVWIHPIVEAFGMGALEAAAHGCPIIMPQGSGVTELFTEGLHGFFPKEGDANSYADYITELVSDEGLALKMGYEAWSVSKKYTWENHAKNLVKILEYQPRTKQRNATVNA
jgi:glycosyltransferase involved in cell wall biosynthesis